MHDLRLWSSQEIGRMKRDLDRLFDDFATDLGLPAGAPGERVSVETTPDAYIIRAPMPHVAPADIRITAGPRRLAIEAVMESQAHGRRTRRTLRRQVSLPAPVDPDRTEAVYDQGVLEVTLPRIAATPRTIPVRTRR